MIDDSFSFGNLLRTYGRLDNMSFFEKMFPLTLMEAALPGKLRYHRVPFGYVQFLNEKAFRLRIFKHKNFSTLTQLKKLEEAGYNTVKYMHFKCLKEFAWEKVETFIQETKSEYVMLLNNNMRKLYDGYNGIFITAFSWFETQGEDLDDLFNF